jgi:hypothetical protein
MELEPPEPPRAAVVAPRNYLTPPARPRHAKSQAGACDFGFKSMISTQAWFLPKTGVIFVLAPRALRVEKKKAK